MINSDPVQGNPQRPVDPLGHPKERLIPTKPTIVIVEDETIVCKLLERAFSKEYQLFLYESAEDFLAQFDASMPHVLLTDKNLPGITGIEMVEKHRQVTGDFEAVLITGYADIDSVILSMDLGIYSYMRKPFELQELKHTVACAQERLTKRIQHRNSLEQAQGKLSEYATLLEQTASQEAPGPGAPKTRLSEVAQGLKELGETLAEITANLDCGPKQA